MTLIAYSIPRSSKQEDWPTFERLVVGLSSTFATLDADDRDDAVARAIQEIGGLFSADECTLLAFDQRYGARVVHSWAPASCEPCTDADLNNMPWLLQRLTRNAVVTANPGTALPHAASSDREHAERTRISVRLAVPVAIGARVSHGLMVASRHRSEPWGPAATERLRLIGEILGGGLERLRHEEAQRRTDARSSWASEAADRGEPPTAAVASKAESSPAPIVGESGSLRIALERLRQVAPLDASVLLLGETGSGKELFARALHECSRRSGKPLVRVNCASLPAGVIESELFGHERGAFTGAIAMRQGRFELADGGTIFLDEIGDLVPELQAKLLRVLQEGEFERVGSSKTRRVDVRVVAATHVNLDEAVADGRFRADLYYRLSVFPIALPSLRDRVEDIPQLVWHFIRRHERALGRRITHIPPSVMQVLQRHDWPGNVRELENVIERAMIRSSEGTLQLDDMQAPLTRLRSAGNAGDTLDAIQRNHIEKVLQECGGRINGANNAAVRLGIHPNTLRFRIKKLGVVLPNRRPILGGTRLEELT
jgi:transcriptional regulator with GAF, ATPase, and Fis domain